MQKLFFFLRSLVVVCLLATTTTALAASGPESVKAHYLPEETAARFGELNILHNNRICQMQTYAIYFTKKLYGTDTYQGLTAEQVLTGWIFWGEEWMNEPMLEVKDGEMKQKLMLRNYVSASTFLKNDNTVYTIGKYVKAYNKGNKDEFHKQVMSIDSKIQLLMNLRRGLSLKIFPYSLKDSTIWYAPTEDLPKAMDFKHQEFIQTVFTQLFDDAETQNYKQMDSIVGKMLRYQVANGGSSLPSAKQIQAERRCNSIHFAFIIFVVCIAMGAPTLLYTISRLGRQYWLKKNNDVRAGRKSRIYAAVTLASRLVMLVAFATLSYYIYLLKTVNGTLPTTNTQDIMLLSAWATMLLSFVVGLRFRILLPLGFVVSAVMLGISIFTTTI